MTGRLPFIKCHLVHVRIESYAIKSLTKLENGIKKLSTPDRIKGQIAQPPV